MPNKLPFTLDTLEADRHFIPVYPENKQWLIVLKGTDLGNKIVDLLEPENETGEIGTSENRLGIWIEKIYGLYQEERQILENQIESYITEKLTFDKHISTVAKVLSVDYDEAADLLDNPYKDSLDVGEKVEPFISNFRDLAKNLGKLRSRLNDDAISAVLAKRFKIKLAKDEIELFHEGMKKALSDFIDNEQNAWEDKTQHSTFNIQHSEEDEEDEGKSIESQTGQPSTMTSKA